jgi:hypothetical protein
MLHCILILRYLRLKDKIIYISNFFNFVSKIKKNLERTTKKLYRGILEIYLETSTLEDQVRSP